MIILKAIFWIFLFIVFYSYIFYGVFLWLVIMAREIFKKNDRLKMTVYLPDVTLLIAVFNEAEIIGQKIKNCFELNYPPEKLNLFFITDGSTDDTNEIIKEHSEIKLFFKPERRGKVAAINRAMPFVNTPIVVFCDANTFLNKDCIREIVHHYADPKIGAVAGEKIVRDLSGTSITGAGEGLYWKYESFLKKLDSKFYSVVGAAGELFSLRTELFEPVAENVLLDDFIISLKIAEKGFRVVYEPKAYAIESPSSDMKEEQKRKIRISAGGFQSIAMLPGLWNIFKHPILSFQYISHRVLRWAVCPFLLPLILIINAIIFFNTHEIWYGIILLLQILFYGASYAGYLKALQNKKSKLFYVPYYFVFMNVSLYIGFVRFLKNKQSVLWDKASRKSEKALL